MVALIWGRSGDSASGGPTGPRCQREQFPLLLTGQADGVCDAMKVPVKVRGGAEELVEPTVAFSATQQEAVTGNTKGSQLGRGPPLLLQHACQNGMKCRADAKPSGVQLVDQTFHGMFPHCMQAGVWFG